MFTSNKLDKNELLVAKKIADLHYLGVTNFSVTQLVNWFKNTDFICVEDECKKLRKRGFLETENWLSIRATEDLLSHYELSSSVAKNLSANVPIWLRAILCSPRLFLVFVVFILIPLIVGYYISIFYILNLLIGGMKPGA